MIPRCRFNPVLCVALLLLGSAWGPSHAFGDGTGFIVSAQGHVLTSYHVVRDCAEIRTDYNGERLRLRKESADPKNDLALYRMPRTTPHFARFPRRGELRAGDTVVTLGFPLPGLLASQASVTMGVVSATAGPGDDPRFLQIAVPIQSGNSGGPLLGLDGSVFGLVFAKLDALSLAAIYGDIPQTINFAIKEPILRAFLWRNGVPVVVTNYERARSIADVADQARPYTLFVICVRSDAEQLAAKDPVTSAITPAYAGRRENNNWAVQLGAFQDMQAASAELIQVNAELPEELRARSEITIVSVSTPTGLIFRAILTGLDHASAGRVCLQIRQRGKSCVVAPRPSKRSMP